MKALLPLLAALLLPTQMVGAGEFDLSHRAWTELLGKHVVLIDQRRASGVAYADLQSDSRAAAELSSISLRREPSRIH